MNSRGLAKRDREPNSETIVAAVVCATARKACNASVTARNSARGFPYRLVDGGLQMQESLPHMLHLVQIVEQRHLQGLVFEVDVGFDPFQKLFGPELHSFWLPAMP
jgi:hypothetical protein